MASSGNNPFDTLAGACNNTLTQTTVSAPGRDTDHIHSSRETQTRPTGYTVRDTATVSDTPPEEGQCLSLYVYTPSTHRHTRPITH